MPFFLLPIAFFLMTMVFSAGDGGESSSRALTAADARFLVGLVLLCIGAGLIAIGVQMINNRRR